METESNLLEANHPLKVSIYDFNQRGKTQVNTTNYLLLSLPRQTCS